MWQNMIDYFQELEKHPAQRMVFLVGGMLLLWLLEGAIPFLSLQYKKTKWRHASVNLTFTVVHLVIHTAFALVIVLLSDMSKANGLGLVYWLHASKLWTIVISFFVLDFFGGWLVHWVQHKIYPLWKFHVVHHSDNNVDVTTGLRHHPIESVLRGVFFLAAIAITGAPMYAVMIYQTVLVLSTQFTHANIHLPRWLDASLSYLFVSPAMHKVHHHWQQPYTDSNYGAVFSVWDRLLGTYKKLDAAQIRYGLDAYYANEQDENLGMLLKKPFQEMRP
ncbi:sterol desaturase family protein [Flavisolibacter ginsengisoli]|jgi:sterol desaturase/sphingolipid hydroxylase (fatty acid hydroxylase superfamily)|uniref:Sterol desaturase/sphingolipid hydroxylase, fatty acid hydroxylase superfamily n=1 Tax=Flavisolibacter ginsengisoli DSM 18119 TaxID=1121884 RepID=A0A1M4XTW4_9BACT|nr:sterol desaturase family protein [Flavisolibacter ginsengisoli]SHE97017.1 Sterol desaturase/sphingolipid hydroxylase, fatty acid hydroxylase superfamily [Flavisolibacter ginsengisoli DSM 18119]